MTKPLHRRLSVFLLVAAVSLAAWQHISSSPADKEVFRTAILSFANPPLLISGHGTHGDPWAFRTVGRPTLGEITGLPPMIGIMDDPKEVFQTSPPSPIDVAVILQKLKNQGTTRLSVAAVLDWPEPDIFGLSALDRMLGEFHPLATAAPVSRGLTPAPLPPSFRRASLPLDALNGLPSDLPTVNRLPIPGAILGGENATAGFTTIESEDPRAGVPLLAVWDDRVIFAFPVVATLAKLQLAPDDLEIRLGEFLRFGRTGPVIPIDRHGRFLPPSAGLPPAVIPAANLLDAEPELPPDADFSHVVVLDVQSAADPLTRRFSSDLPQWLAAIDSEAGLTPQTTCRRLSQPVEAGLLIGLAAIGGLFAGGSRFRSLVVLAVLAAIAAAAQWIGVGVASTWLPGLPALAGTLTAIAFVRLVHSAAPAAARSPMPDSPPPPQPPPAEEQEAPPEPPNPPEPPVPAPASIPGKAATKPTPAKAAAPQPVAKTPKKSTHKPSKKPHRKRGNRK